LFPAALIGKQMVGFYPLLEDDSCYFVAVDFDEADWQQDAQALMQSCGELGVPASLEISRSDQGAHAWIFFADRVSARDARRLGTGGYAAMGYRMGVEVSRDQRDLPDVPHPDSSRHRLPSAA
jgi:hypothetical protein